VGMCAEDEPELVGDCFGTGWVRISGFAFHRLLFPRSHSLLLSDRFAFLSRPPRFSSPLLRSRLCVPEVKRPGAYMRISF
jgi:hypothetical protein